MRHRHGRKPPGTATPSAYRHRASRRLYPPPANDPLDVETPHEGLNRRQLFLILRRHTVHGDRAAAVGTTRRDRHRVDLVDAWGRLAPPLLPVVRTAPSPRTLAASLPPVLGEGGRLPLAGAPGLPLLARHISCIGKQPPHLHTFSWIFSSRLGNRRRPTKLPPPEIALQVLTPSWCQCAEFSRTHPAVTRPNPVELG